MTIDYHRNTSVGQEASSPCTEFRRQTIGRKFVKERIMPDLIKSFGDIKSNNLSFAVKFDRFVPIVSYKGQEISRRPSLAKTILPIVYELVTFKIF